MQTDFEKYLMDSNAKRLGRIIMYPTKDGKHSQYKKTELHTRPIHLGMESKLTSFLKKMTRGKSMAPAIFLMGMAGGAYSAYYLCKQKGADCADDGPTNHPSEDLTKLKMPRAPLAESDQK